MAEKISIQIALEGGDQIAKQLANIGEAGQKAFADISKSAEQAGGFKELKPDEVATKLKEMGVTGVDSIKKIQDAVASAGKLETLVQGITSVETAFSALASAAPIIGTVIVAAFAAAAKAAFAFADAVNKVSDEAARLGVSIEKLDQFNRGLEQAGISAKGISDALAQVKSDADKTKLDQVTKNFNELKAAMAGGGFIDAGTQQFRELTKAAEEFTPAGKAAREALDKLGFGIPGTTRKDVQELGTELAKLKGLGIDIKVSDDAVTQAQKIITALAQMSDKALAAQIAMQRFGAAGPEMVAGLRTGSITIQQFTQQFATMTAEQEAAANKQRQVMNTLSADWERFKVTIGAPIAIAGMAAITATVQALGAIFTTTKQEALALWGVIDSGATVGAGVIGALAAPLNIVGAAIVDLGSKLGGITWDAISSAGVAAWNAIVTAVQGAGTAITDFVSKIGTITWDIISGAGVAAWNALTGAIQRAIDAALRFIGLKPSGPATGGGAPGKARGGLLGGRGSGTSDSNLAWVSRGEHIMPAAVVRQPGVLAFLEALRRGGSSLPRFADGGSVGGSSGALSGLINELGSAIGAVKQIWDGLLDGMQGVYQTLQKAIIEVVQQSDQVVRTTVEQLQKHQINIAIALGHLVNALQGQARGGLLGGRGTGTSDSNLAWVSRGEYITPARAVAQPGVLAFLEALRRSGGNLSAVLDGMGRFALGGMIRGPMPAFAGGGLAGGMSNVTIQFPGLPAISGLRASSDVVDQLHKAAALAQVRSGGRKPSRYS